MNTEIRKNGGQVAAQAEQMEKDLGRIRQAVRKQLEAEFEKGDLTVPQKAAMGVIVRNQGVSLKDLSRELSLAHSTVSGIVDRLEKKGMVERRPDANDGRVSEIHPTTVVTDFLKEQVPLLTRGPLEDALLRATAEERAAIGRSLSRLRELLEGA